MGLFRFLTKRTKQVQDDVFGLLTFRPYKMLKHDYFVGSVFFGPAQTDVDVYIHADYKGPTPAQRDLYAHIQKVYPLLLIKLEVLAQPILKPKEPGLPASGIFEKFRPGKLVLLPLEAGKPAGWVLYFFRMHSSHEGQALVCTFEGDKPTEITLEAVHHDE